MHELIEAYWKAGGEVSDLGFRLRMETLPEGSYSGIFRTHYWVEAFEKKKGMPQFFCGHCHWAESDAIKCRDLLEDSRIEMLSDLVG